jgi:hypothetical protein
MLENAFLRTKFADTNASSIKFINEPDVCGLRHEFMSFALQQLASPVMICGPDDQKMLLKERCYEHLPNIICRKFQSFLEVISMYA